MINLTIYIQIGSKISSIGVEQPHLAHQSAKFSREYFVYKILQSGVSARDPRTKTGWSRTERFGPGPRTRSRPTKI